MRTLVEPAVAVAVEGVRDPVRVQAEEEAVGAIAEVVDPVVGISANRFEKEVGPRSAMPDTLTGAEVDRVSAASPVEVLVAEAAAQLVVAAVAEQVVGAVAGLEHVVAG